MAEYEDISEIAREAGRALASAGATLATAESCTGGWIAKALTDVAGSSGWFGWGVVTYGNGAKIELLGVREESLARHGAVSETVVREMAAGALAASGADIAVAVSGVAGPDGGTAEKPVGTVWFAWSRRDGEGGETSAERRHLEGDREAVRRQTVCHALAGVLDRIPG